ncbi:hypothetical protein JCM10207_007968 [Rhodosporidiobolus poonsookiae]
MATATAHAGPLLPPFIPLPQLSTTFQTTPATPNDLTPLPTSHSPTDYFSASASSDASTPSPVTPQSAASTASSFFGRLRSNSLHSSAPFASSSLRRSASPPPPMPAVPSTPSSTLSLRSDYLAQGPSSHPLRPVKNVTVPHYAKSGRHTLYACRVVPEALVAVEGAPSPKMHSRRESLGRMQMAGEGEPHTVWRSWSEFVDFAGQLALTFPDDRPRYGSPSSSTSGFPSPLYHHVPRLGNKKIGLFMKRSGHEHRQAELEQFCVQLFRMAPEVKQSQLVLDFFRLRPDDTLGCNRSAMSSLSSLENGGSPSAVPEDWLSAGDPANDLASISPNATLKPLKPKSRPALAVKTSSPNLRAGIRGFGFGGLHEDGLTPPPFSATPSAGDENLLRPLLTNRAFTVDAAIDFLDRPDSKCSMATTSSSMTVTPGSYGARSTPPTSATIAETSEPVKSIKKKRSGPLRHFRSLQDLRGSSKAASRAVPDEPVPELPSASAAMARAATQPLPRGVPSPLLPPLSSTSSRRPSNAASLGRLPPPPLSAPVNGRHRRNGSSKSSNSSFEELWGTPFPSFRQTPAGRVECVARDLQSRRPSAQSIRANSFGPASVTTRPSYGPRHRSSASISSVGSTGSAGSSSIASLGMSRSGRSSMDWPSQGSEMCPTPPTPQMGFQGNVVAGKYYVENGELRENNTVPPPPFFPVPPPMQFAYSHDGLPHTPRSSGSARSAHGRKSSNEGVSHSRSRTGSSASTSSRRVLSLSSASLDPILASPAASSAASSPRCSGSSPSWTFKLLHKDENLILRITKSATEPDAPLSLDRLRAEVVAKFKTCGVALPGADGAEPGEWGLGWTSRGAQSPVEAPTVTKLIVGQEDLDRCLREQERGKVVLKVIC